MQWSSKRDNDGQSKNLNNCNVCNKKKKTSMIQCNACAQWVHCNCVGLNYTAALKKKKTFLCDGCTTPDSH